MRIPAAGGGVGHKIYCDGLKLTETKVHAVAEAPEPQRVDELRSFLGLVNSYGKFLHGLASMAAPLYQLLQKDAPWVLGKVQRAAFKEVKKLLESSDLLVHFDPQKQLVLDCYASPVTQPAKTVLLMEHLASSPVSAAQIRSQTGRDPTLSKVRQDIMQGWPTTLVASPELQPYYQLSQELSVEDGCLLRGTRVIVLPSL